MCSLQFMVWDDAWVSNGFRMTDVFSFMWKFACEFVCVCALHMSIHTFVYIVCVSVRAYVSRKPIWIAVHKSIYICVYVCMYMCCMYMYSKYVCLNMLSFSFSLASVFIFFILLSINEFNSRESIWCCWRLWPLKLSLWGSWVNQASFMRQLSEVGPQGGTARRWKLWY